MIVNGLLVRVWVKVVYLDYRFNENGNIDETCEIGWVEPHKVVPLTNQQRINDQRANDIKFPDLQHHSDNGECDRPYDILRYIKQANRKIAMENKRALNRLHYTLIPMISRDHCHPRGL